LRILAASAGPAAPGWKSIELKGRQSGSTLPQLAELGVLVCAHSWDRLGAVSSQGRRLGRTSDRHEVTLHRLITGATPDQVIVFRDGNGLNCSRANLLVGNRSDASHTQMKHTDKLGSKFKGVYFEKQEGRYHAQIMIDGKRKNLGRFATEKEAAEAYDRAALEHFHEFAATNFARRRNFR
jgi:hypothetical protein